MKKIGVDMKIQDIMTKNPKACRPETDLAAAAMMMWDGDCGVLPVVDDQNKVRGVITDRDICIAVASKHRRAEEIHVKEVTNGALFSCRPDDTPKKALKSMSEHRIRRLPVTDKDGHLQGMVSLNDLALSAKHGKGAEISEGELLKTLQAICRHPRGTMAPKKQKNRRTAAA